MAPRYPVFTQNSNKALNELKKLDGFGSELENLIGAGSAADGISAADVANYLKELGSKTSLHDANIVNINGDLTQLGTKTSLHDTNIANINGDLTQLGTKTSLHDTNIAGLVAKTDIHEKKLPGSLLPVALSFDGVDLPTGYAVAAATQGQLATREFDNSQIDAFVSMYNVEGISTEWNAEFVNAPLTNGTVSNVDNIITCPSAIFDDANKTSNIDLMTTKNYSTFAYECDIEIVGTGNAASLTFNIDQDNYSYLHILKDSDGVVSLNWMQNADPVADSGLSVGDTFRVKLYGYEGKFIALLTDLSDVLIASTAHALLGTKPLGIKANPNVKVNNIRLSTASENNKVVTEWTQAFLLAYTYAASIPADNQAFPPKIWVNQSVTATGADTVTKIFDVSVGGETRKVQMHISTPKGVTVLDGVILRPIRQGGNWYNTEDFIYENINMDGQIAISTNIPCISFYVPGQHRFDLPNNGVVTHGFIEEALTKAGFPPGTKVWVTSQTGGCDILNTMLHKGDFDNYDIQKIYYGAPALTAPWEIATTYTDVDSGNEVTSNVPVPDDKADYQTSKGNVYYRYYLNQADVSIEDRLRAYLIQMKTYGANPSYVVKTSMISIIEDLFLTIADSVKIGGISQELKDKSYLGTSKHANKAALKTKALHDGITTTTTVEEAVASLVGDGPNALFSSGSVNTSGNPNILHPGTAAKLYVSWARPDKGLWVSANETTVGGSPTENSLDGLATLDEVVGVDGVATGNSLHVPAANWSIKKPLEDGLATGLLAPVWSQMYWPKNYVPEWAEDIGYTEPWSDVVISAKGVEFIIWTAFVGGTPIEQKNAFKERYGVRAGKLLTVADKALLDTTNQFYGVNFLAATFSDYTINAVGASFITFAPYWLDAPWNTNPEYLDSFKRLYDTADIKLLQSDYDNLKKDENFTANFTQTP